MVDLFFVAAIYLLALIGLFFLVVIIVGVYVAYHYEISFKIGKTRDDEKFLQRKPRKKVDDASAPSASEAHNSKAVK